MINSIIKFINGYKLNKENRIRRGVTEYRPSQIGGFFLPTSPVTSALISGGDNHIRSQTINAVTYAACVKNIPVVIIHETNSELETMLWLTFANSGKLTVINRNSPFYDPFVGLSDNEISNLIMDSITKNYDVKPNAKYYIDGMLAYIRAINKTPSLNVFAKCPHSDLFNKVDNLIVNGIITDVKGQDIKSRLMQGQSECYKLENYFSSLENQFSNILSRKTSQDQKSISSVIDNSGIILVDITSNVNNLMLNILLTQIKYAVGKGKNVSFIADELSTENNELFTSLVRMHNDRCILTVCSRDVFAMCGSDEKIFNTLLGNSGKVILYRHSSGASATKWAESIGYYDKAETSISYSTDSSRQSLFQSLTGLNTTSTTNYNLKREFIIKPEEITRMQLNEVYILDGSTQELAHTKLI